MIFSMGKEMIIISWEQVLFVHRRIVSAVKRVEFVRDRLSYTGCPRRNVPDFGRAFLMLKYTDITQNTYTQS